MARISCGQCVARRYRCATAEDLYSGHQRGERASCASTFSNQSPPTGCAPSRVTLMCTNFRANTAPGRLPEPYHQTRLPPYNLSRDAIEKAINAEGFQLWRLRDK